MSESDKQSQLPAQKSVPVAAIEAAEKLGQFFSNVFGEPIKTSVGMLQDKLGVIRWERQLRLADRVKEILDQRRKEGNRVSVPPRMALPIIEAASIESDDFLQDLWANLLASAMNSVTAPKVRSAFVDIIKQLEPIDVKLLEFCYKKYREKRAAHIARYGEESWYKEKDPTYFEVAKGDITQSLTISGDDYLNAVDNLIRVRLLASYVDDNSVETEVDGAQESYEVSLYYGYESLCITALGLTFVKTCTPSYTEEDEKALIERLRREEHNKTTAKQSALESAISQIQARFGDGAKVELKRSNSEL
ncbi:MAG: DUF4393 domain-containing protein [Nitrospira sp.]|nr:DUF4393 domain-containing protein [Nitrospira sp.]